MKRVYKYLLAPNVMMPKGARILCVQVQNGVPYLWALVPSTEFETGMVTIERRVFWVFSTGQEIPDELATHYIGTFQQGDGRLVFHVFEAIK